MIHYIDVSDLSMSDCERVVEATKICIQNDCGYLLQDTNLLEVVDLLIESGLMKKKRKWW